MLEIVTSCHCIQFQGQLMVQTDLVGFWICAEISGMLKKNRLEELVPLGKRSAWLHTSILQNFARWHFFDVSKRIFMRDSYQNRREYLKSITKAL